MANSMALSLPRALSLPLSLTLSHKPTLTHPLTHTHGQSRLQVHCSTTQWNGGGSNAERTVVEAARREWQQRRTSLDHWLDALEAGGGGGGKGGECASEGSGWDESGDSDVGGRGRGGEQQRAESIVTVERQGQIALDCRIWWGRIPQS